MKSAEEMAHEVLERRDAYVARRRRQTMIASRVAGCTAALLCVLAVGLGVFNNQSLCNGNDGQDLAPAVISLSTVEDADTYGADGDGERVASGASGEAGRDDAVNISPRDGDVVIGKKLEDVIDTYKGQDVLYAVEIVLIHDNESVSEKESFTIDDIEFSKEGTASVLLSEEEIHAFDPGDYYGAIIRLGEQ